MELLQRIQRWYTINCNGDWEHSYGISITNIDNPGWKVNIDLNETCIKNVSFDYPIIERTPTNWVGYSVKEAVFRGSGGPENLTEILIYFLDTFLPAHIDPDCTIELHLPVRGYENRLWLKAEGKMLSESTIEVCNIADTNRFSYEWGTDADLNLFSELGNSLSELGTDYLIGDHVEPYVYQAADNILRTFLVAPVKR
ncbi:immunity 53 family protein [Hymenobacter sp. DG25B]|uniref:immunity 53 family protein n=1 Tax=Hymenobacter sp. DG25B TaxID=1385664 RepID=UPI0009006F3A|nr:immunity 53 family protein [Hymenobacter sp. DG25B]